MNNMQFKNIFLGVVGLWLMGACSPTSVSMSSQPNAYREDLSAYRPPVPEVKDTAKENAAAVTPSPQQKVPFTHDVTQRLDGYLDTLAESNSKIHFVDGFAIQVYAGSSSQEANQIKAHLNELLEYAYPVEVKFHQPIFKVRVGNFTERLELQKAMNKVRAEYPNAISVPKRIYIN